MNDYMCMDIHCNTKDFLELSDLTEFQGNLKERENTDYEKIEKSIKKHGFSFPFFVWKHDGLNHVLDGHGRLGALKKMAEQGENIPPLPVVYVDCKNEKITGILTGHIHDNGISPIRSNLFYFTVTHDSEKNKKISFTMFLCRILNYTKKAIFCVTSRITTEQLSKYRLMIPF